MALLLVAALGAPIPLRQPGPVTEKACTRCGEVKPLADFYRDSRARDGRAARCKLCASREARKGYVARGGVEHLHELRAKRLVTD